MTYTGSPTSSGRRLLHDDAAARQAEPACRTRRIAGKTAGLYARIAPKITATAGARHAAHAAHAAGAASAAGAGETIGRQLGLAEAQLAPLARVEAFACRGAWSTEYGIADIFERASPKLLTVFVGERTEVHIACSSDIAAPEAVTAIGRQ